MIRVLCTLLFSFAILAACSEKGKLAVDSASNTNAVIGGEEVAADDNLTLTVVALRDKDTRDNVCTGTLLTKRIVLTAAHCVEDYLEKNDGLEVVLGHSSWEVDRGEVFTAEKIIAHPRYLEKGYRAESDLIVRKCVDGSCDIKTLAKIDQGDLALIRLNADVPENMVPVILNKKTYSYDNGTQALVVGFGQHNLEDSIDTGFMRSFKAPVYRRYNGLDLTTYNKLAIPSTTKTGACFGDSGGPAFVKVRGQLVQVGVAQAALEVDSKKKYACGFKSLGYTDVAAHLNWIQATRQALEKLP